MKLPVIPTSCDGCGACCLEQNSPPGYIAFLGPMADEFRADEVWREDAARFDALPAAARAELEVYAKRLMNGEVEDGSPCLWLDQETMRCRWYEHRPGICRNALKVGDEGCLYWRAQFGIGEDHRRRRGV